MQRFSLTFFRRLLTSLSSGILLCCLAACSSMYKNQVNFDTTEPLRVAVLPFAYQNEKGEIEELKPDLLIDDIPVVSSKLEDAPANYVRKLVFSGLERTGMDLIPPAIIENAFHHHGFSQKNILNVKKIYAVTPAELGDLLDCDAVVYGRITDWSRSYYGIQTVNSVGLKLKIVSTKTGKVLFTSEAEDSDSRGISKGPTGWSSLIIEPVQGLDNQIITDLARTMVSKMLDPLAVRNRPEFLKTPAPAIYASSHDLPGGIIRADGHLTVVLLGTPKRSASFSIGNKIQNIPMLEKDESHYIGEYYPLPSDVIANEPVTVSLTDQYGRVAIQTVGVGPVSIGNQTATLAH
jgi:hypothetical protein